MKLTGICSISSEKFNAYNIFITYYIRLRHNKNL